MQGASFPPETGFSDVTGNTGRYKSGDNVHPSDAGHALLGKWFAEKRRAITAKIGTVRARVGELTASRLAHLLRCTIAARVGGTAIITGAAGGIGAALVAAFAVAGYRVVAIDRAPGKKLEGVRWIDLDLARLAGDAAYRGQALAAIAEAADDRCDMLINNAAVQRLGDFATLADEEWQATLAVNLLAPVVLIRRLMPLMPAGEGVVINISSIHAHATKPGFTAYAMSKAALSGLTRALAVELGHRARFVAIEPAAIGTPMLRAGFADDPAGLAALGAMHPAGRIGTPEEVARLALTLCDPALGFVNGTAIGIDGGIAARLHHPG